MTTHRVTTIYPGLDLPVVEDCDCPQDVDHVEVYSTWSELFVMPVTRVARRLRGRPAPPDHHDHQEGS